MKLNGISSSAKDDLIDLNEMMGDEHVMTSLETPMKSNAFDLTNAEKKAKIAHHFEQIMETLGLDLSDDSLKGTPARVAKMYVEEVFSGLDPKNKPKVALFENKYLYKEMLVEKDITVKSFCEHHFVPIVGRAHVAYKSNGNVIGLSKINRVVQYYAKRPQVQERLTVQIAEELKRILKTEDVAVMIDARHMCVSLRGVEDDASSTVTTSFHGSFLKDTVRTEFLTYLD
ncbi:MAG TPA: GTP cyclohydrolase I FolE [Cryomorphaceae bacterium]|nr:GTP cyclohydrolase I FolE [Cryomorphaceae bacterium]